MVPARSIALPPVLLIAVALTVAPTSAAAGERAEAPASLVPPAFALRYDTPPLQPTPQPARFGARGQQWWTFGAGVAHNFASDNDINLRASYSRFIGNDPDQPVEIFAEINLWYFLQKNDDALGINPAFGLRWHFFNGPRWSWFADAGIGLLLSTGNVPDAGTSFNFTPRFGLGATWQISPTSPDRLQVGLRWHHVSNARINGDTRNPARDSLMLYAGVMLPF